MKILMIGLEFPPIRGGGGTYVHNLINGLAKQGVQILTITSGERDCVEKIDNYLTIKRYRNFLELYEDRGGVVLGVDQIIKEIRDFCPDIIHTQHSIANLLARIANENYGIPHL